MAKRGETVIGDLEGDSVGDLGSAITDRGSDGAQVPKAMVEEKAPEAATDFAALIKEAEAKVAAIEAQFASLPDPVAETMRLGKVYQAKFAEADAKKKAIDAEVSQAHADCKKAERAQGAIVEARNTCTTKINRAKRDLDELLRKRAAARVAGRK